MRPGLLCPGKVTIISMGEGPCASFNEAGAVMPRKAWRSTCSHTRRRERFNEAGAVMPRKEVALAAAGAARLGFNEAGAVMPRKVRAPRRRRAVARTASMRPGLLCPGKQPLKSKAPEPIMKLQ